MFHATARRRLPGVSTLLLIAVPSQAQPVATATVAGQAAADTTAKADAPAGPPRAWDLRFNLPLKLSAACRPHARSRVNTASADA